MKATPFVIQDEDGRPAHSGMIASAIDQGFWLVQFDAPVPGKPGYAKVVSTVELTKFTLFRNIEERAAFFFVQPPPVMPDALDTPPAAPAESLKVPDGNPPQGD